jgi:hypothetical protein
VQDAFNLGWKLAHALRGAPDTLLETYQAERLPIARGVLASTSTRHREYRRDFGQAVGTLISGTETFADPSQMSITYRGSSLAHDVDDSTSIRAGDRAPDATCSRASSGDPVRLFDLFHGPHFTLLVFGDQPTPPLPIGGYDGALRTFAIARPGARLADDEHTLFDIAGDAHRAYGVSSSALILVRPDGYVGLTSGTIAPEPLIDYLKSVIGLQRSARTERA